MVHSSNACPGEMLHLHNLNRVCTVRKYTIYHRLVLKKFPHFHMTCLNFFGKSIKEIHFFQSLLQERELDKTDK